MGSTFAARRAEQVTGQSRDGDHHQGGRRDDDRISRLGAYSTLETRRPAASAAGIPSATPAPTSVKLSRITIHRTPEPSAPSAHADTDFIGPPRNGVGHESVNADAGQKGREQAKESGKTRQSSFDRPANG